MYKFTAAHMAAQCGFLPILKTLKEHGADFTLITFEKNTVLHLAAEANKVEVIAYLSSVQRTLLEYHNQIEETPLHVAARQGHIPAIEALIKAGAEKNSLAQGFRTPLHIAAIKGHSKAACALFDAGADIWLETDQDETALDLAIKFNGEQGELVACLKTEMSRRPKLFTRQDDIIRTLRERLAITTASYEQEKKEHLQLQVEHRKWVEYGLSPTVTALKSFLEATKRMVTKNKVEKSVFISYAWEVDGEENNKLQKRLCMLRDALEDAGIYVRLDISRLSGDIDHYMEEGIKKSDNVLLICTPRLKERVEVAEANNMKKELSWTMEKQREDPQFIIPLIFSGTFRTSLPMNLDGKPLKLTSILFRDFTRAEDAATFALPLASVENPLGLLCAILGFQESEEIMAEYEKNLQHLKERLQIQSHA